MKPIDVIETVCDYFSMDVSIIMSQTRRASAVQCRYIAMYLVHKHTANTFTRIGGMFGGRDHSTVIHGVRSVEDWMVVDKKIKTIIQEIEEDIMNLGKPKKEDAIFYDINHVFKSA